MDDGALQMLVDGLLADTVGRRKVRERGGRDGQARSARRRPRAARRPRMTEMGRRRRCGRSHLKKCAPPSPQDAIKQLLASVAVPSFLADLDAATLALRPDQRATGEKRERERREGLRRRRHPPPPPRRPFLLAANTWPGLLRALLRALAAEIVPGGAPRARPPDAATSKALRTFLEAADAPARWPGTTGALDRAAGGLLVHVRDVLRAHDGTAPVATEYGVTLRTALLLRADYCAATPAGAFQDLIEWAARGLTGADADPATAATTLALLLRAAPADVGPRPRPVVAGGLKRALRAATGDAADARTVAPLLAAAAAFLEREGPDLDAGAISSLHGAAAPALGAALSAAPNTRAPRDAGVSYAAALLAAGGLAGDDAGLLAMRALVRGVIAGSGFAWGAAARGGRRARAVAPALEPALEPLLRLAADLELDVAVAGLGRGDEEPERSPDAREPKRLRADAARPPLSALVEADPARWAPVAAATLATRGRARLRPAAALLLAASSAAARARAPAHGAPAPPPRDAAAAGWLLRLTADLARCWPVSRPDADGDDSGESDGAASSDDDAVLAREPPRAPPPRSATLAAAWSTLADWAAAWAVADAAPHALRAGAWLALAAVAGAGRAAGARSDAPPAPALAAATAPIPPAALAALAAGAGPFLGPPSPLAARAGLVAALLDPATVAGAPGLAAAAALALLGRRPPPASGADAELDALHAWLPPRADEQPHAAAALDAAARAARARAVPHPTPAPPAPPASEEESLVEAVAAATTAMLRSAREAAEAAADDDDAAAAGGATPAAPDARATSPGLEECSADDALIASVHAAAVVARGLDAAAPRTALVAADVARAAADAGTAVTRAVSRGGAPAATGGGQASNGDASLFAALAAAMTALAGTATGPPGALARATAPELRATIRELRRLAVDADDAAAAAGARDGGANAAGDDGALLFDDELDADDARPMAAHRSAPALAAAVRGRAAAALGAVARVAPSAAGGALLPAWAAARDADAPSPPWLAVAMVDALVVAAGAGCAPARDAAAAALATSGGLLPSQAALSRARSKRAVPCAPTVLIAAATAVRALAHACGASGATADALLDPTRALLATLATADAAAVPRIGVANDPGTPWRARAAVAAAVAAALRSGGARAWPDADVQAAVDALTAAAGDVNARACAASAPAAASMLTSFVDADAVWAALEAAANPVADAAGAALLAAALPLAPAAERRCMLLALRAASLAARPGEADPGKGRAFAGALRAGAAAVGYASRAALVAATLPRLAYDWVHSDGTTPVRFLDLAAPAVGCALARPRALLTAAAPHLVPALATAGPVGDVQLSALAGLLEVDVGALLRSHFAQIVATVMPSSSLFGVGPNNDPIIVWINAGAVGSWIPDVDARDALFQATLPAAVAAVLARADARRPAGADPPPPSLSPSTAAAAVRALLAQANASDELAGPAPLRALAAADAALARAASDDHRLAALGVARATLDALGDRAATATPFRAVAAHALAAARAGGAPVVRAAASLLADAVDAAVATDGGRDALADPDAGPALLAAAGDCARGGDGGGGGRDAGADALLADSVAKLAAALPQTILAAADPLPEALAAAAAAVAAARAASPPDPVADLARLAARAGAMSPPALAAAADAVRAALRADPGALVRGAAAARAAAWRLVGAARAGGPVAQLLAAVMADVGCGRDAAPAGARGGWIDAGLARAVDAALGRRPAVVAAAQDALEMLAGLDEGAAALERAPAVVRARAAPYAAPARAGVATTQAPRRAPPPRVPLPHDSIALWAPTGRSPSAWARRVASALAAAARSPALRAVAPLAAVDRATADLILPHALADGAVPEEDAGARTAHSAGVLAALLDPGARPAAVRAMLACLDHLHALREAAFVAAPAPRAGSGRTVRAPDPPLTDARAWLSPHWLDVPASDVAAAALRCGAPLTALFYAEAAIGPDAGGGAPRAALAPVLLAATEAAGDRDALYWAAEEAGADADAQLTVLGQEGRWADVAAARDAAAARGVRGARALPAALLRLGCPAAALAAAEDLLRASPSPELADARAEAAWRMGRWRGGGGGSAAETTTLSSFNASVCACLESLQDGAADAGSASLDAARSAAARALAASGEARTAAGVVPAVTQLQVLAAVDDGWAAMVGGGAAAAATAAAAAREATADAAGGFPALEPLLAARRAAAAAIGDVAGERDALLALARAARRAGRPPAARAALAALRVDDGAVNAHAPAWLLDAASPSAPWRREEVELLWDAGQPTAAVRRARALLAAADAAPTPATPAWRADLLIRLGTWLATSGVDGPDAARSALDAAHCAAQEANDHAAIAASLFALASFADSRHRAAADAAASPEWATAAAVTAAKRADLAATSALYHDRVRRGQARVDETGRPLDAESKRLAQAVALLTRQVAIDDAATAALDASRLASRVAAVKHYGMALSAADGHDLHASHRLVALFLAAPDDADVVAAAKPPLALAPSHKYVLLAHQAASRLSASPTAPGAESGFQDALRRLLVRLATDHPHHTLWQLLALQAGGRGRDGKEAGARGGDGRARRAAGAAAREGLPASSVDYDKVDAAKEVLSAVRRVSEERCEKRGGVRREGSTRRRGCPQHPPPSLPAATWSCRPRASPRSTSHSPPRCRPQRAAAAPRSRRTSRAPRRSSPPSPSRRSPWTPDPTATIPTSPDSRGSARSSRAWAASTARRRSSRATTRAARTPSSSKRATTTCARTRSCNSFLRSSTRCWRRTGSARGAG